jgi:hypothetical protein
MTPKEEAKKIYERFLNISHDMSPEHARRSAIEAVDLISSVCNLLYIDYFLEIKEELENGDCI